jgi:hypothetical protein
MNQKNYPSKAKTLNKQNKNISQIISIEVKLEKFKRRTKKHIKIKKAKKKIR